eukprot:3482678-Amphidinium_carterae.1
MRMSQQDIGVVAYLCRAFRLQNQKEVSWDNRMATHERIERHSGLPRAEESMTILFHITLDSIELRKA